MSALYDASVPLYLRGLNGLLTILDKAAAHSAGGDPSALLGMPIAVKLNPMAGQVVSACNRAGRDPRMVLGQEVVKREKPEPTFSALKGRVAETMEFLRGIDVGEMNRAGDGSVTLGSKERGNLRSMNAVDFILMSSIPQFFFHLTTTYVILRHNGVALRKPDFLGSDAPS